MYVEKSKIILEAKDILSKYDVNKWKIKCFKDNDMILSQIRNLDAVKICMKIDDEYYIISKDDIEIQFKD